MSGFNTRVVEFKQRLVQVINESQLPPVVVDMALGELKNAVSADIKRALTEEKEQEVDDVE